MGETNEAYLKKIYPAKRIHGYGPGFLPCIWFVHAKRAQTRWQEICCSPKDGFTTG